MNTPIKKIFLILIGFGFLYYLIVLGFGYIVNSGISNSESSSISEVSMKIPSNKDIEKEKENNFSEIKNIYLSKSNNAKTSTGEILNNSGTVLLINKKISALSSSENKSFIKENVITEGDLIIGEQQYVLYNLSKNNLIDSKILNYLLSNYNDIEGVLESYDSFNDTDILGKYRYLNKEYKDYLTKSNTKEIFNYLYAIKNGLEKEKGRNKNTFPFISTELMNNNEFIFVFNGIKNHYGVKTYIPSLSKNLGIEKELVYASIMTEQTRYSITQRGNVKKYLKNIPFLFSYTYGSKGIGGIKDFTATKIEKDSNTYGYGDIFNTKEVKDLNDKYWEVVYPTYLIKNIIDRWNKDGFPIDKNPGAIITLYNFGNVRNKIPHSNPEIGGSIISISNNKKFVFGELGRNFYWYFKIYGF